MSELVMLAGGRTITDSRTVAPRFRKRHGDVLRVYDNLECDEEFNQRNFASVDYLDAKGQKRRMIQMTKDGFMLLVMGFTGKEATAAKVAFINAFNRMAEFIETQAKAAFEAWEAARMDYQSDQEHVSRCGKDLSNWKSVKPRHLARLEELNPQIVLPLGPGVNEIPDKSSL